MLDDYTKRSEELKKKHAEELRIFHSFQENIIQLTRQRHHKEVLKSLSSSQSQLVAARHREELTELAQAKALAFKLLHEEQKQELANLKSEAPKQ